MSISEADVHFPNSDDDDDDDDEEEVDDCAGAGAATPTFSTCVVDGKIGCSLETSSSLLLLSRTGTNNLINCLVDKGFAETCPVLGFW